MENSNLENQSNSRPLTDTADALDHALSGARQHLRALRQSSEWQDPQKRRHFLQDLANRLRAILAQIEAEV